MTSLVLQLQADALKPEISVSNLLLKAKVVATKLKIGKLAQWVEYELNGYYEEEAMPPEYRVIHGVPQFYNPVRGWRNVMFDNPKMKEIVSKSYAFESLSSLENLVTASSAENSFTLRYSDQIQQEFCRLTNVRTEFQLLVSKSALVALVDAVRQTILGWSLKLESAGILGDGMQFSDDEKKSAKSVASVNNYNIQTVQNVGVLGNVSDSATVTLCQAAKYTENDIQSLLNLVKDIENNLDRLPERIGSAIKTQLIELKSELAKPRPNNTKIRSVLLSIKNVAEGAVGSLIASGILSMIAPYIGGIGT